MTERELRMFRFIQGLAANATRCGACEMANRNASEIIAEVRVQLTLEELQEIGLAPPVHCEDCEG